MGNGTSKATTAQDQSILEMKMQRDRLQQYRKRVQRQSKDQKRMASDCLKKGDKSRALLILRQCKYHESLVKKTDQQLATLQQLVSRIEFALVQKDVIFGLEQGNQVLKELNNELNMDRVESIMDQSRDGIQQQQEISEMLSQNLTNSEQDEVDDELEELARQEMAKKLPEAPRQGLAQTEEEEEEEEESKTPSKVKSRHHREEQLLAA